MTNIQIIKKKLADALRLRGETGRLEFGLGLIAIFVFWFAVEAVLTTLVGWAGAPAWLYYSVDSLLKMATWCAVAALAVTRLRHLRWPIYIAFLPIITVLADTTFLIAMVSGYFGYPNLKVWFMLITVGLGAMTYMLLLSLLIWDESLSRAFPPRHRAVLLLTAFIAFSLIVATKGGVYQELLDGWSSLPTLTQAVLPWVHLTPYFLIGSVPAIFVVASRGLPARQKHLALAISSVAFALFVVWLSILWLALVVPINKMGSVM
ncbi:MAG: hypothetical protein R3358_02355 [Woeseiaceae bacterium]|nr:hypothetical protein [Woeseiaceae bacterium]